MRAVRSKFRIKGEEISQVLDSLELTQPIDGHHRFVIVLKEMPEGGDKSSVAVILPQKYTGYLGEPIKIGIEALGQALTFDGIVTKVSFRNTVGDVNKVVLTGASPTLLMDLAKKNRFFHEKGLAKIAQEVLTEYDIQYESDASSGLVHPFCVQYQETDYHLISRLAQEEGLWSFWDGGKFRIASDTAGDALELRWRETLLEFEVGLQTRPLNYGTDVYNYEQKKTYHQTTQGLGSGSSLPELNKVAYGASERLAPGTAYVFDSRDVVDQKGLDTRMENLISEQIGQSVFGVGRADIPGLSPGRPIKVVGLGKLDGEYLLTTVAHTCNETGQYECSFECAPVGVAHPRRTRYHFVLNEIQSAVVTSTDDPEKLGRVKISFHWNSEGGETPWVRVATLHAGTSRGSYWIPEVGDEVLVAFRESDPDHPVVIGSLYNKQDRPREDLPDPGDDQKAFVTKSGNTILLKDTDGEEEILIYTKEKKNQVSLKMGDPPTIALKSEGNLIIEGKEISIEADEGFSCTAGKTAEIKANQDLTLKGSKADIKGDAGVKIAGAKIELN